MSLNTPPTETPVERPKGGKFRMGYLPVSGKFSEQDKQYIVSLWATGLTPSEVKQRVEDELHQDISTAQIIQYSHAPKWQKLIEKVKNATYSNLASVAGSHKGVRLNRAEKIYEKAITKNKLKEALAATEHQRKEMEGGGDFNLTMNQYNLLSDEELEFKKKEVMERIARQNKGVIDVISADKTTTAGAEEVPASSK